MQGENKRKKGEIWNQNFFKKKRKTWNENVWWKIFVAVYKRKLRTHEKRKVAAINKSNIGKKILLCESCQNIESELKEETNFARISLIR